MKNLNLTTEKIGLHPRNKPRHRYDFAALIATSSALKPFVSINTFGNESIDFANPDAVKALNKALLQYFYGIDFWDIPANYLCPPVPSRAEYLHRIADVLSTSNNGVLPTGNQINILDIGIGANCIYPIIGHQEYGWHFVGSDVDAVAIQSAEKIITSNIALKDAIECRLQTSKNNIFKNIIQETDFFDCTICNPPFHASLAEASKGTMRKLNNLSKQKSTKPTLNFGGQTTELWCEGGEIAFISKMITESVLFKANCRWFSTLVSKHENLGKIYRLLKNINAFEVKTIPIEIGNKVSRIFVWRFLG